jgi:GNAT superfamily N-acetyltransferase
MSTILKIRSFRPSDAIAVRKLFASSLMDFADEVDGNVPDYIERSLIDDLADIPAHYLNERGSHFWVAERDSEIVGIVGVQRRTDEEAELRRMSVASGSRRLGIGQKLLEICEKYCRDQGYCRVRLTSARFLRPAISMYRARGYKQVGKGQDAHGLGIHFIKQLGSRRCPDDVKFGA